MKQQIETLRGFACVLLVLYHVIGADPAGGLQVTEGPIRWGNDTLAYLRMPLFTFLSGLVYGLKPFTGDSNRFLRGKVRRLLLPMLVVGTLFAVLQNLVPGTHAEAYNWWRLHLEPVAHFWFLESLFWVFLVVWLLELARVMNTRIGMVMTCMVAGLVYVWAPKGWYMFSIEGAFYLLPYFMVGLAITRLNLQPWLRRPAILMVLCLLAWSAATHLGALGFGTDRRTLWVLVMGVMLCALCLVPSWEWRWLARIGTASYAIYLFHVFFTAATRIVLHRVGVDVLPLHLTLGLLMGVAGPVLVNQLALRNRWSALLLLGKALPLSQQAIPVRTNACRTTQTDEHLG